MQGGDNAPSARSSPPIVMLPINQDDISHALIVPDQLNLLLLRLVSLEHTYRKFPFSIVKWPVDTVAGSILTQLSRQRYSDLQLRDSLC
jgi:hypothetical protein